MARPAKSNDDQRGPRLICRLTPTEMAAFEDRVRKAGIGRSEYIRQAVLHHRVVVRKSAAADPALILELNRIGVNLNQLTRTANSSGKVTPEIAQLCRRIEGIVLKAIKRENDDGADDRA